MFKRKKDNAEAESVDEVVVQEGAEAAGADAVPGESLDETGFMSVVEAVPPGPYDATSVPTGGVSRVDLGSMQIAGFTEMQLHFESDPSKNRFVSIVATFQDAALRLQPLAAPRSGGLWEDMRAQISSSIAGAGGDVEEVEGLFGTELHGVVPAVTPDGEQVRQPVRLVGYEGPRWMLHGVFMGSASIDPRMAELFEDVFQQTVVVRGDQPMAPGDVLPITLPPEAQAAQQDVAAQVQQQQGESPTTG